jgi:hypothetical protein
VACELGKAFAPASGDLSGDHGPAAVP